MKVVIPQNLKPEDLGRRKVDQFSKTIFMPSNDGMRRDYEYTDEINCYGNLTKGKKTKKGEFPEYKYSYYYDYTSDMRDPEKSEDLERMIIELLSVFNVHEFKIVEPKLNSNDTISISKYYLPVNIRMSFSTYGITCKLINQSELIANSVFKKRDNVKYDSLESAREKMNPDISSEECAAYILSLGDGVEKNFSINLSLDEIDRGKTIIQFRDSLRDFLPKIYSSFDEAERDGAISKDDIKAYIKKYKEVRYFAADKIPTSLLEELLSEDITLLDRFATSYIPLDVLKKFKPDFSPNSSIIEDSFLTTLKSFGFTLFWEPSNSGTNPGQLRLTPPKGGCYYDGYCHEGCQYENFNFSGYNKLKEVVEKVKTTADEAEKRAAKEKMENAAREMGYMYGCKHDYYNVPGRIYEDVYVISKDGKIRDPDPTSEKNTKLYNQILPGEIVVSCKKIEERFPSITVLWADNPITDVQLGIISEKILELSRCSLDESEIPGFIDLLNQNIRKVAKEKAQECRNKLKVVEKSCDDLSSEIARLSKEESITASELHQAGELLKPARRGEIPKQV